MCMCESVCHMCVNVSVCVPYVCACVGVCECFQISTTTKNAHFDQYFRGDDGTYVLCKR